MATGTTHDERSGLRVLVVDDAEDAADMLALLLSFQGHEVDVAYDGLDAVRKLLEYDYDLAYVDISLPGCDGYQVARQVRAAGCRDACLIALTGFGGPEHQDKAMAAGFDRHVTKPLAPPILAETVALATHKFSQLRHMTP